MKTTMAEVYVVVGVIPGEGVSTRTMRVFNSKKTALAYRNELEIDTWCSYAEFRVCPLNP
jgi:hypothetical protein